MSSARFLGLILAACGLFGCNGEDKASLTASHIAPPASAPATDAPLNEVQAIIGALQHIDTMTPRRVLEGEGQVKASDVNGFLQLQEDTLTALEFKHPATRQIQDDLLQSLAHSRAANTLMTKGADTHAQETLNHITLARAKSADAHGQLKALAHQHGLDAMDDVGHF